MLQIYLSDGKKEPNGRKLTKLEMEERKLDVDRKERLEMAGRKQDEEKEKD
jgi:hypothetical protein